MIGPLTGPEFTKKSEGFVKTTYDDTKNHPTVGFGFNLDAKETKDAMREVGLDVPAIISGNKALTMREAEPVFQKLYTNAGVRGKAAFEKQTGVSFDNLNQDYKDIITDLVYNMGAGAVQKFTRTLSAIAQDDRKEVAKELMDSSWYDDVRGRARNIIGYLDPKLKQRPFKS